MLRVALLPLLALTAGCLDLAGLGGSPIDHSPPRCGESPGAYDRRISPPGAEITTDYGPDHHDVQLVAGDPWRIVVDSGGAFGFDGQVELAPRHAVIPDPATVQRKALQYGPFCAATTEFPVDPTMGPWTVTLLEPPMDGRVELPILVVVVAAGPGANGTWEGRVAPPSHEFFDQEEGADLNGTRPGPWFSFAAGTKVPVAGYGDVEDFAQAWGHVGQAVQVRAGLPTFSESPRVTRLIPLSPGLEPLDGPASWRDEGPGLTYYDVKVPANGTWRLGVQVDWEPIEGPVVPGGTACWVLASTVTTEVHLRWQRMDGPCR